MLSGVELLIFALPVVYAVWGPMIELISEKARVMPKVVKETSPFF
jgi:hypothetical protein